MANKKNFNEQWGFVKGQIKGYGLKPEQVEALLEGEAKKDFSAALRGVPDEDRAWASLQAGYHLASQFYNVSSGDNPAKRIDSATYMKEKHEILLAAGIR